MKRLALLFALLLSALPASAQFSNCQPGFCSPAPAISCPSGNVIFQLSFEGANGATGAPGFTDLSAAAHGSGTSTGGTISTAQFKFGTSSFFNTSGAVGHNWPAATDYNDLLPTANSTFTIQLWFRPVTTTPKDTPFFWNCCGGSAGWLFYVDPNGNGELSFNTFGLSSNTTSSGLTWIANQWYYISVERDASHVVRIYRDNTMVAKVTATGTITPRADVVNMGTDGSGRLMNGYMDDARIIKGQALCGSDTPCAIPTAPFSIGCP